MITISDYITSIRLTLGDIERSVDEAGIANDAPNGKQGMLLAELDDLADRLNQMMFELRMRLKQEKK